MSQPIVETRDLGKSYGGFAALADCNLLIETGEVFGLLGPNGAGKTTLIRLLLGYLKPSSGSATAAGFDCVRQSVDVRRMVAYLPAEASLFPLMRGREVLQFFADIRPGGSLQRSLSVAKRLDLDLSRHVGFMSTGMKQKLALAATLAAETAVYILDEPTANLDPSVRSAVLELVAERRAAGKTVIFSSHVLSEVEAVCDRVGFLRRGRLVRLQRLDELRAQHRITAWLSGELPPLPAHLQPLVRQFSRETDCVKMEAPGELAPLLAWFAAAPLTDIRIEPLGLRAIYDRCHNEEKDNASPSAASRSTIAP
jgi:ABC-2 type transport system ATP-binding protein